MHAENKPFSVEDARELGRKEGREAAERGESLSMGITWDDCALNEAYDEGVNEAQKAFVLEKYPKARCVRARPFGELAWTVSDGEGVVLGTSTDAEYAAWEEAAAKVGR